ncbi:hypothetical protein PMIN02_006395 [Paraphaeosphaeria minitans]
MIAGSSRIFAHLCASSRQSPGLSPAPLKPPTSLPSPPPRYARTTYDTRRTATFSFRKEEPCEPALFYDVISTSQLYSQFRRQSVASRTVPPFFAERAVPYQLPQFTSAQLSATAAICPLTFHLLAFRTLTPDWKSSLTARRVFTPLWF